jgi:hypothetical protein
MVDSIVYGLVFDELLSTFIYKLLLNNVVVALCSDTGTRPTQLHVQSCRA